MPEAELVPVGVFASHEPAHARHGHRLVRLAAKFPPRCGAGVDAVDVEVGAGPVRGVTIRVLRVSRWSCRWVSGWEVSKRGTERSWHGYESGNRVDRHRRESR
jgi:hypothetical protein